VKLWRFYFVHSLRDLARNRQRTLFALFCVAAGVAAVVALRMMGLMIIDALTTNIAALNRGDLRLTPGGWQVTEETVDGRNVFSDEGEVQIRAWAAEQGYAVTAAITDADLQLAVIGEDGRPGRPQYVASYFVEPALYPFYGEVTILDPAGVPLRDLLIGSLDIVVSDNLASFLDIQVGDSVRLGGAEELFTVRGIAATEGEAANGNMLGLLWGYVYLALDQAAAVQLSPQPDEMYLQVSEWTDLPALDSELRARFGNIGVRTRDEFLAQNQFIADTINDFVLVMGLAAMVVGGIGIINTMLVVVRRRTVEIAVLKTLGLKGTRVTLLFFTEAVLMGVLGSLLGVAFGLALSFVAQRVGEQFLQQPLRWRLYADPIILGMAMGVPVTVVFGFLPTLAAAQVRPAAVLRPMEALVPRAGLLQRLFALVVLTLVLGVITGQIVGDYGAMFQQMSSHGPPSMERMGDVVEVLDISPLTNGILLAAAGMLTLGVLVALFWVLVWLVSKLPSFGVIDLKLALRSLTTNRTRTASSLLALTGGVFALSLITLMSTTVIQIMNISLTEQIGGNVISTSFLPGGHRMIAATLDGRPGVTYTQYGNYRVTLTSINGDREWYARLDEALGADRAAVQSRFLSFMVGRDVRTSLPTDEPMLAGRPLGPEDAGRDVAVLRGIPIVRELGLQPGDVLRFSISAFNRSIIRDFEVVGITDETQGFLFGRPDTIIVPLDALESSLPAEIYLTIINVEEPYLNETLNALAGVLGSFTLDVSSLNTALERLMQQMASIPLLVAGLALFAGATIIANTVALATLERRRQIGVMKALGLKTRRVLGVLLLENAIIGLVGGLVGVGVGALSVFAAMLIGGGVGEMVRLVGQTISGEQVFFLVALSIGLSLLATILTAWGASRERPLNVLRYE